MINLVELYKHKENREASKNNGWIKTFHDAALTMALLISTKAIDRNCFWDHKRMIVYSKIKLELV